jgi:predicted DNA-binding transcriptional regulator AlpA
MRNELASLLNCIADLPATELPGLLGELEIIRATVWLKMAAPGPIQAPDQLLPVGDAAQRLGVSKDYLYRHADQFPFTRQMGRKLLFSSRGIDSYLQSNGNGHKNSLTARQRKRTIGIAV